MMDSQIPNQNHRTQLSAPERCKKCGEPFHCSKSAKCWCYELSIPAEKLEELQKEYDGCLCPDCLKEYEG
jgi:ribosomal protein L34E